MSVHNICSPFFLRFCLFLFVIPDRSDSQSAGSHMRSNAHGKREVDQFHIREIPGKFFFECIQFIRFHCSIGKPDFQKPLVAEVR